MKIFLGSRWSANFLFTIAVAILAVSAFRRIQPAIETRLLRVISVADLHATDLDGNRLVVAPNRDTTIVFWFSSLCPATKDLIPQLSGFLSQNGGSRRVLIAYPTSESKAAILFQLRALEAASPSIVQLDERELRRFADAKATPSMYIVDQLGKLKASYVGRIDIEAQLAKPQYSHSTPTDAPR